MAKTSVHVYTERTEVEVSNPNHQRDNYVTVKLDDEEFNLPQVVAEELQQKLECAVVDESYRYKNMQAELDKAQKRIEELEETLHNIGYQEAV